MRELELPVAVEVWVPCHITCFFEVREHENPIETGSRGAGLNLDLGVKTKVRVEESSKLEVVGGIEVSRDAVKRILEGLGLAVKVEVHHDTSLPLGVGFGVSGAMSLGASLALSVALNSMTIHQAGAVAHITEVEHMTGLGDVIAQVHGGVEVRVREGAPGVGVVDWIPHPDDLEVVAVALRSMTTKEMIEDRREVIDREGRRALINVLSRPTLEVLMSSAREFAEAVGFIDLELKHVVNRCVELGALGASVKKGVLYAVGRGKAVGDVYNYLKEQFKDKQVVKCGVSRGGPRVSPASSLEGS